MSALGLHLSATLLGVYCLNILLAYSAYPVLAIGRINLAYVAFAGVGGYGAAMAIVHRDVHVVLAAAIGIVAAALLAVPLGALLGRVSGTYLAIASLNVVVVLQVFIVNLADWTGGSVGLLNLPRAAAPWMLVTAVVAVSALFATIHRSGLGAGLRVQRADELLAVSVGVPTGRNVSYMFVISAVIGALYGVLSIYFYGFVSPESFSFNAVILALAMVILGGRGSWAGPLVGATFFTILPEWFRSFELWTDLAVAGVLLLVAVYAPEGVTGMVTRLIRLRRTKRTAEASSRDFALGDGPA